MSKDFNILITNDDSLFAPGIKALVEAVDGLGKITVIAPDKPQSGMGHAITIAQPLRIERNYLFGKVDAYTCSGTPADCVKLATAKILHKKPNICLSGINHGANYAINILYSGTMSAAIEAAIENIPSIGFSLLDYSLNADFNDAKIIVRKIVEKVIFGPKINHLCLNVNIPAPSKKKLKGIKICRQADAKYDENFVERNDPSGKKYFWLTGTFNNFDKRKDTDVNALEKNYVSVVPVQFDLTNEIVKNKLEKDWKF